MDVLIEYFAGIPSAHRALILAGGIAFFWIAESAAPFFRFEYRRWDHARVNVFFTLTTHMHPREHTTIRALLTLPFIPVLRP